MSNSNLVSYTKISPNRNSPRNHKIDTITIHCVVGQCTVESLGAQFAPTARQASSNYGIGKDGRIGMYVEEKDRAWTSSNRANDNRAITIEVASDTTYPYAVNDKAMASLIELCTDICKRNGIEKLIWSTNKTDRVGHKNGCNMTVHRDFAATSCPGDYLYERHGYIAAEVNKRLSGEMDYNKLIQEILDGKHGASQQQKDRLRALCFEAKSIVNDVVGGKPAQTQSLVVGDSVKLVKGAAYSDGKSIPSWVFNCTLYVRGFRNNKKDVMVSTQKTGAITGVVSASNVKKV